MSHFSVNSLRPVLMYILLLAVLVLFGFAMHRGLIVMPFAISFPYQKLVAKGLFGLGLLFGVGAMLRNMQRSERPWAIARSQINVLFTLFMVVTTCAIVLAK